MLAEFTTPACGLANGTSSGDIACSSSSTVDMPNALASFGVIGQDMDTGVDGCESRNLAWFREAVGVSAKNEFNQSEFLPATDGLTS